MCSDDLNLNALVQSCSRRIQRWPIPSHWSRSDWREEIVAHCYAAACEAIRDFDVSKGVPVEAFVCLRIMARALTRYRQEWSYSVHCDPLLAEDEICCKNRTLEIHDALQCAISLLPAQDRWLLHQLFCDGCSEADIAHRWGISQQGVSKRKRAILNHLRLELERLE